MRPGASLIGSLARHASARNAAHRHIAILVHGSLGAELLRTALADLATLWAQARPQDAALATHAPKLHRADGELRWHSMSLRDIWLRHRALHDRIGVHTTFRGRPLRLLDMVYPYDGAAALADAAAPAEAGTARYDSRHGHLCVRCADGWTRWARTQLLPWPAASAHKFASVFLHGPVVVRLGDAEHASSSDAGPSVPLEPVR